MSRVLEYPEIAAAPANARLIKIAMGTNPSFA